MSTEQYVSVSVSLQRRVIVKKGLVFQAERGVTLPIEPFVGLALYNACSSPPGCEESLEYVEEVAYNCRTGRLICYLGIDDYRPESSGSDWAESEVRENYLGWTLKLDDSCRPTRVPNGN